MKPTSPPARRGRRHLRLSGRMLPFMVFFLFALSHLDLLGRRERPRVVYFQKWGKMEQEKGPVCVCVCAVWSSGLPSLKRRKNAHITQRLCLHRHEGGDEILAPDIDGRGRGREPWKGSKKSSFSQPAPLWFSQESIGSHLKRPSFHSGYKVGRFKDTIL